MKPTPLNKQNHFQLTDGLSDAVSPAWDANGKYLYFLASTNLALGSGWLDMSSIERPLRRSVYFMVLKKGDPSPLLPESDEEKIEKKDEPKADAKSEKNADKSKDKKTETPEKSRVHVQIDLDGLSQRILSLSLPAREYSVLKSGSEGEIFLAEVVQNQDGQTLYKYTLKDRKVR